MKSHVDQAAHLKVKALKVWCQVHRHWCLGAQSHTFKMYGYCLMA